MALSHMDHIEDTVEVPTALRLRSQIEIKDIVHRLPASRWSALFARPSASSSFAVAGTAFRARRVGDLWVLLWCETAFRG